VFNATLETYMRTVAISPPGVTHLKGKPASASTGRRTEDHGRRSYHPTKRCPEAQERIGSLPELLQVASGLWGAKDREGQSHYEERETPPTTGH